MQCSLTPWSVKFYVDTDKPGNALDQFRAALETVTDRAVLADREACDRATPGGERARGEDAQPVVASHAAVCITDDDGETD